MNTIKSGNNNHLHDPNGTIRQIKPKSRRRRDGLIKYAYNKTSQSGEDGIINFLFQKIPSSSIEDRWLVDVGAWDGIHLSNSHSLLIPNCDNDDENKPTCSSIGSWKGILIEADQDKFKQLSTLHEPYGNICHHVTVSCQSWSKSSLGHILANTISTHGSLPYDFDFLCIDVDGTDYWLLHNILHDTQYRPKVICIEFNPTIPHSVLFIPPRNDFIRQGCSITALVELASLFDYQLVETTCYNAFFVYRPLYDKFIKNEIPFEPCIDNLHEITMGTHLYQLYDGTIKLSGCQKMLWHRIPIKEEDVQIIKRNERNFPFAPGDSGRGVMEGENTLYRSYNNNHDSMIQNQEEEMMMFRNLAIDMSPYCLSSTGFDTSVENKTRCSVSIYQQLEKDGFALVRGTGIPSAVCQEALTSTNAFLQEASEKVRRSCLTKDRARRGYSPQNSENFASLVGEKGSNDLVRKFRVGPSGNNVSSDLYNETSTLSQSSLHQPNAWPTDETWGEENASVFRSNIEKYYDQICHVANDIVRAISDGITHHNVKYNIPLSFGGESKRGSSTEERTNRVKNTSILTLLGYRKGARHQGKHSNPLIAAHTDVGVITVLLFDAGNCASLQRCQSNGGESTWIDVKLPTIVPEDPIFVVNIGDCLSDMCGNALPSTLHRVVPCKGGSINRNCLALFMGLNHDDILNLPDGESMTYEEWRRLRIARAQDALSKHLKT